MLRLREELQPYRLVALLYLQQALQIEQRSQPLDLTPLDRPVPAARRCAGPGLVGEWNEYWQHLLGDAAHSTEAGTPAQRWPLVTGELDRYEEEIMRWYGNRYPPSADRGRRSAADDRGARIAALGVHDLPTDVTVVVTVLPVLGMHAWTLPTGRLLLSAAFHHDAERTARLIHATARQAAAGPAPGGISSLPHQRHERISAGLGRSVEPSSLHPESSAPPTILQVSLLAPFRALRPSPGLAAEVAELPYDVMTRDEARSMVQGRPQSFLHVSRPDVDLPDGVPPDGPDGRALATNAFQRMQRDHVLVRDTSPALYAYRLSAGEHQQTGVVGVADMAGYHDGRIRRHELTTAAKQADRAEHMVAIGAQTGPVFSVHRSAPTIRAALAEATQNPAETSVDGPGGVRHEIWPITDAAAQRAIVEGLDDLGALYIADGHHRSAAAADVHERLGRPSSAGFLTVAFPADEVQVLPYNRLLRAPAGMSDAHLLEGARRGFAVEPASAAVNPATPGEMGLYVSGQWYRLLVSPDSLVDADLADRLDAALLQSRLLAPVLGVENPRTAPNVGFVGGTRPLSALVDAVDSGGWTAAVSLHATSVDDLMAVADAGGLMPPKSTWFEPKLLDGLVSHVLD